MSKIPEGATHYHPSLPNYSFRRFHDGRWQALSPDGSRWVSQNISENWLYRPITEHPDYVAPEQETMTQVDWSKAPEGATHFHPISGDWYRRMDSNWEVFSQKISGRWIKALLAQDRFPTFVARPEQQQPWDGAGLPPVGAVCEVQTWVNREWRETTVLAHHLGFAVHSWSVDGDDMEVEAAPSGDFRPLRTPEQIAAEEREKAVQQMAGDIGSLSVNTTAIPVLYALYDAGYKKQAKE